MRTLLAVVAILSFGFGSVAAAKPHCKACPYSCDGLGLSRHDCTELGQTGELCCVDLSRKGLKQVYSQEQISRHPGDSQPLKVPPSLTEKRDEKSTAKATKKSAKS